MPRVCPVLQAPMLFTLVYIALASLVSLAHQHQGKACEHTFVAQVCIATSTGLKYECLFILDIQWWSL